MPSADPPSVVQTVATRRRWSIRNQLLIPMVLLVLGTSLVATSVSVIWLVRSVRQQHRDALRRVIETLTESTFPLTRSVLEQMQGLSGVSFVLVDSNDQIVESTINAVVPASSLRMSAVKSDRMLVIQGKRYVVDSTPMETRGTRQDGSTLFLLRPEEALTDQIYQAVYPAILAGGVATIVALVIATWLARHFVRPINELVGHAAVIAQGNFVVQEISPRNDELGDLADSINVMSRHLKEYATKLRSVERMETLTQIGAALAHQLRNSAAGGRMAVELHRRNCSHQDDEALTVALRQFKLMESYLRQFLSVGGEEKQQASTSLDFASLIRTSIALLRPMADHAGIALEIDVPGIPVVIRGNENSLRQLVTNLVINGIEAAAVGQGRPRRIHVSLANHEKGRASLFVNDSGDGPAPDMKETMFEPLATNKSDGIGLGLFVARQIAEHHDGRLSYKRMGEMTSFRFEFPFESGA